MSTFLTMYVDGTFLSASSLFHQLFTIQGFMYNAYIPHVFCLLPGKGIPVYEAAVHHVMAEIIDLRFIFQLAYLYGDFDKAVHTSGRNVWPSISTKGCRFHLGRSWWRNIQKCGSTNEYKDNQSEIGRFLKCFFGLPFLRPDDVGPCLLEDFISIQPDNERVRKFTDYAFDNYVEPNSSFSSVTWADYSSTTTQTTNPCESFYSHLIGSLYAAHPDIYILADTLLQIQCDVYAKIRDVHRRHLGELGFSR